MVTEEWKRAFQREGKRRLGKGLVGANSQHLDVQLLQFLIVGSPGRQVFDSRRAEGAHVELNEEVFFAQKLMQADGFSSGARECEIRGFVTDFQSCGATHT